VNIQKTNQLSFIINHLYGLPREIAQRLPRRITERYPTGVISLGHFFV
jgi:hypothetical protein